MENLQLVAQLRTLAQDITIIKDVTEKNIKVSRFDSFQTRYRNRDITILLIKNRKLFSIHIQTKYSKDIIVVFIFMNSSTHLKSIFPFKNKRQKTYDSSGTSCIYNKFITTAAANTRDESRSTLSLRLSETTLTRILNRGTCQRAPLVYGLFRILRENVHQRRTTTWALAFTTSRHRSN